MAAKQSSQLEAAREEFLTQWGTLGPAWGVSRTMSQIHALLLVSRASMNTDEIMDELGISRGNAHTNITELCKWGLLRRAPRKGERKEYFEAEKDVWRVVQIITRERKRKELQPVLETLDSCLEQTRGLRDAEAKAFRKQLKELQEFAGLADRVMEQVGSRKSGVILPWLMKFLK